MEVEEKKKKRTFCVWICKEPGYFRNMTFFFLLLLLLLVLVLLFSNVHVEETKKRAKSARGRGEVKRREDREEG